MIKVPLGYRLQKTELIGIEPIQDLLELTLYSAYVKFERVVSTLIVSEPEGGKTEHACCSVLRFSLSLTA